MKKNKTYVAKPDTNKKWYLVNAEGKILGRMAVKVADILRGKQKPEFTRHVDTGDFVIVLNAEKIRVTGKKLEGKMYFSHSGYPRGAKLFSLEDMLIRKPEEVIRQAVWGMIPKGPLGRQMIKKLKIYKGTKHPHSAQCPEEIK